MAYVGAGYIFGTDVLTDGKTGGSSVITPTGFTAGEWNRFKPFQLDAQNAVQQGDFHGHKDMSGAEPPPAPTGQTRSLSIAGEHYLSRNGRPRRRVIWDRNLEEFNLSNTPIDPTGVVDSSAGIQAALDWAKADVDAGRASRVIFPPGRYLVGSTLVWRGNSARAPELIGEMGRADSFDSVANGLPATLVWNGADGGTLFYAEAANNGLLENIAFLGNNKAGKLVHLAASLFSDPSVLAATAGIRMRYCKLMGVKPGVDGYGALALGTDTALTGGATFEQADAHFEHLLIIPEDTGAPGFSYAGMKAYGVRMLAAGNCKLFSFERLGIDNANIAYDFDRSSGPLTVKIADIGDCRQAFRHNAGSLLVEGGDIECSHVDDFRLLTGSTGVGSSAVLKGIEVAAFMAGSVGMLIDGGGHIVLEDCPLLANANSSVSGDPNLPNPFQIRIGATPQTSDYGSFTSRNNWYRNCGTAARPYIPVIDGSANDLAPGDNSYGATVELAIVSEGDVGGPTTGSLIPLRAFDSFKKQHWQVQINALMPGNAAAAGTTVYESQVRRAQTKVTLSYTDFQAAALLKDINIGQFQAGTRLWNVRADVTVAFAGTAGTLNLRCGIGAGDAKVWPDKDVKTAVVEIGTADADYATGPGMGDNPSRGYRNASMKSGIFSLFTRLTSGSGNLSGLSAGSVTFYIEYEVP